MFGFGNQFRRQRQPGFGISGMAVWRNEQPDEENSVTNKEKPEWPKKDYRGLLLCEPCWNNQHFITPKKELNGKLVAEGPRFNNCKKERCDCPCSNMQENWQDHLANVRSAKIANTEAQMTIADAID